MSQALSTDVLIVGGGIAGLWLNARLRRAGYATLLVEADRLGGGQSVKSQGIIHGGTKYALHGALTGSSEAIAGAASATPMPRAASMRNLRISILLVLTVLNAPIHQRFMNRIVGLRS